MDSAWRNWRREEGKREDGRSNIDAGSVSVTMPLERKAAGFAVYTCAVAGITVVR